MSLQWQAVAGFLYFEIFFTSILILPILSPATWKKIFNFRLFSSLQGFWKTSFYASLLIIIVLFVDSIRVMMKYDDKQLHERPSITLDTKLDFRLHECRGQRNFYITGFSLFLMFVIYRLVVLLFERAKLEASHQAALSQAQNVSRQLQQRLEDTSDKVPTSEAKEASQKEKEKYISRITDLEQEIKTVLSDRDAMRKQSESVTTEYDRLLEEHRKLQNEGSTQDKKNI